MGAGYPPNQNEEISSKQIGQSTANARIKKTTLLIILEGSSNCRLSCPILDEKEATKEVKNPLKRSLESNINFLRNFLSKQTSTSWEGYNFTKILHLLKKKVLSNEAEDDPEAGRETEVDVHSHQSALQMHSAPQSWNNRSQRSA